MNLNEPQQQLALSFSLPEPMPYQVQLMDLQGRLLFQRAYTEPRSLRVETAIPLNDLANGLYLVQVVYGQTRWMRRFLVN